MLDDFRFRVSQLLAVQGFCDAEMCADGLYVTADPDRLEWVLVPVTNAEVASFAEKDLLDELIHSGALAAVRAWEIGRRVPLPE